MRSPLVLLAVVVALLAAPVWSLAAGDESAGVELRTRYEDALAARLAVVEKTEVMVQNKIEVRSAERRHRVRALYKLARASFPRLWFDPDSRIETSRWLGAARRIAMRDACELALLDEELVYARKAERRLQGASDEALRAPPAAGSLQRPTQEASITARAGLYREPSSGVKLRRRGVELQVSLHAPLRPVAAGVVRYAGPIAGKGKGLIIEHEGIWSVMAQLGEVDVARGDRVEPDTMVGRAHDTKVYLELRVGRGSASLAVDPEPLLKSL